MNANSELRLTEEKSERRVNLVHGEISLNVAHDPNRPFVVCAGGFLFRDLGTTFNVVGKSNSVVLTVVEGEVSLEGQCGDDGRPILAGGSTAIRVVGSNGRVIGRKLAANDQMTIVTSSDGIIARARTLSPAEMSFVTSWREGVLKFDGANLRDAIDGVNRNCNVEIELGDPTLAADADLHGTLKLGRPSTIDGFLKAVKEIYGLVPAAADPLRPRVVTLVRERHHRSR
ncbi:MAG TPA: FecR domain-containing protein [Steroidobacteraceae bacterium]|jgi:transmembrane sensor